MAGTRHNVLILNGPNLNMLGVREPGAYGKETLDSIAQACQARAGTLNFKVDFRQSNHEGELVTWIQEERENIAALVINAGAYTHTSIALHDALRLLDVPIIEVHVTNIHGREEFRRTSYVSPLATGMICGFKGQGYVLALDALASLLNKE